MDTRERNKIKVAQEHSAKTNTIGRLRKGGEMAERGIAEIVSRFNKSSFLY